MDMGNRKTQFNIWYWIVAFVGLMIFQSPPPSTSRRFPTASLKPCCATARSPTCRFPIASSRAASSSRRTASRCSLPRASSLTSRGSCRNTASPSLARSKAHS